MCGSQLHWCLHWQAQHGGSQDEKSDSLRQSALRLQWVGTLPSAQGGGGETWLGDECPHFYTFQKYSLSMRNGTACTWAEGKLPFPLTCSHGLRDRKLRQHGLQRERSVQQESPGHAESQRTKSLSREGRNEQKSIESG
ncbi:hypothetical protein FQN60_004995, partial [Etheostoma spectabile]